MSYEQTEIGALLKTNPAQAAEALEQLLLRARGNSVHAALIAGVHHSTLKRWVSKLEKYKVRKKLEKIRSSTEPRGMSPTTRANLAERTSERRRVAGLQRMFDRLDASELVKLASEVSCDQEWLVMWRKSRAQLDDTTVEAIDGVLGRMQLRYRSQLRSANRAKKAAG
jgi:hypothetical protein